jgi:hypothetical protein
MNVIASACVQSARREPAPEDHTEPAPSQVTTETFVTIKRMTEDSLQQPNGELIMKSPTVL